MNFTFNLQSNRDKLIPKILNIWFWTIGIILSLSSIFLFKGLGMQTVGLRIGTPILFGVLWFAMLRPHVQLNYLWLILTAVSSIFLYFTTGIFFSLLFLVFFAFLWFFMQESTQIIFDKEHIFIKSFLQKQTITWSELSNVVLKDQLLTLDFKSNKIFQQEIATSEDEHAFNAFVQTHLSPNED